MEKLFCVISHTHWDREWYQSLDQFRLRLVDLMDDLLEILEENPAYIFHLDAQTIVLEDYLEIRPYQNRCWNAMCGRDASWWAPGTCRTTFTSPAARPRCVTC